jgi:DNA-binding transcriptional LysR family regulator
MARKIDWESQIGRRLRFRDLHVLSIVVQRGSMAKAAAQLNERWILSAPGTWNHTVAAEAFRARGLDLPEISLKTLSIHLRANLLATGPSITMFPHSVLRLYGNRFSLKVLPVDLPVRPWPVTIVTLKNRTLSPVVEPFIECAREVAKSFAVRPQSRNS